MLQGGRILFPWGLNCARFRWAEPKSNTGSHLVLYSVALEGMTGWGGGVKEVT